ncbi:MAG: carbohydrate ABC transporter permease [Candidatus Faecivivens sp.]|nr:carbohydrate ABC transporter permease [Oscillospiraceae bacterium]MDY2712247.1 carbohydrate ABC transporter permease [Candidatus Faecivivens sp.]
MRTKEERIFQIIGNILMMLAALAAIIPLVLLVSSSFTENNALIKYGYRFFPTVFSTEAYSYVFSTGNSVLRAYFVSFLLTAVGTVVSLIITTMLAYPLARQGMPFRGVLTFLVFFTMLFNGGLVPTYINYTNVFHIKNTFWAILIPGLLMNAYNVLLTKSYFVTGVPSEILEAASIDGASEFKTFVSIALPMAKPIIATIGMFVGIAYWNDWNNGIVYLTSTGGSQWYSIQSLLYQMMNNIQYLAQNAENISTAQEGLASIPAASVRMAMAVMGVLPIVVIYPFIQNNFVKGITLGGVKG